MSTENENQKTTAGIYERAVGKITEWVKPYLHRKTQEFVNKSIEEHANDNPKFARIIEFEVRRRGDGAGMTQDVAEPLLWTGIKTAVAFPIAMLGHSVEHGKFKVIGYATAIGILLNNAVELFRTVPRYTAGLQGSLEMAKDRWRSIEETGIDPFNQQSREINKGDLSEGKFTQLVQKKPAIAATTLLEKADKDPQAESHSL